MKHSYELKMDEIILKPLEKEDIEKLRILRNNLSIYFISQKQISKKEQQQWYNAYLKKDDDIMFKVVLADEDNEFVGAVALYDINREKKCAEFGRIIVDNKKVTGIGVNIVQAICRFGYDMLGLEKIVCDVLKDNKRAIHIYEKVGFETVREDGRLVYMEKKRNS